MNAIWPVVIIWALVGGLTFAMLISEYSPPGAPSMPNTAKHRLAVLITLPWWLLVVLIALTVDRTLAPLKDLVDIGNYVVTGKDSYYG